MKYFDVFTGVGGFCLGMPKAFECVGMSEVDRYCNNVLRYRFPDIHNFGDITKIDLDELPDFDLLVGGSPCQDFSLAGERKGLSGSRSSLFWHYADVLKEKRPSYFIFENVDGLLSSNRGWDFAFIQSTMAELGYSFVWTVYNTGDFGIPLQRSRVFIIGSLGEERCGKILYFPKDGRLFKPSCYPAFPVFTKTDWKGPSKQRARIITKDEKGIRVFTPIERERLMGWPDDWTKFGINDKDEMFEISKTQRMMMTGNGVSSVVVKFIVESYLCQSQTPLRKLKLL